MENVTLRFDGRTDSGGSDLLLHGDAVAWREEMAKARADLKRSGVKGAAGDDRSPAHTWIGCVDYSAPLVSLPSDNIMTCLREGAAKITVPGKRNLTYKRSSQTAILVDNMHCPIMVGGKTIDMGDVKALIAEPEFDAHVTRVAEMGFELFVKPVRMGQSKHIRVRPRFREWTCDVPITLLTDDIDRDLLVQIAETAGRYCGIGDWRPSSPRSPGSFGRFAVSVV